MTDSVLPLQVIHRSGDSPSPSRSFVSGSVDAVLAASVDVLGATAVAVDDPLHGEMLGSDASGIWWAPGSAPGTSRPAIERRIGYAYGAELLRRGDAEGLAAARALQAGASPALATGLARAAERLADSGLPEPPWWDRVAGLRARRGAALSGRDDDQRMRIVLLELERAGDRMTLGALIDSEAGGVVRSLGIFERLERVCDGFRAGAGDDTLDMLRPITVGDARHKLLRAIERTDLLGVDEPLSPGFVGYRGMALRWLSTIAKPGGACEANAELPDVRGSAPGRHAA